MLLNLLMTKRSAQVVTVNPEIAALVAADPDYRSIVAAADCRTVDGIGVAAVAAARLRRPVARVTGVQLLAAALEISVQQPDVGIRIIGASEDSRRAAEVLMRSIGATVLEGASPQFASSDHALEQLVSLCKTHSKQMILLALGAPKQEFVARDLLASGVDGVCIGVGGAVDYFSGAVEMPPHIITSLGLEWLYRLLRQPRARLRRQATRLPMFVAAELGLFGRRKT